MYPELKEHCYKEHSNIIWNELLTTKFGIQVNTHSSTHSTLHGSRRAVEKSGILLHIEKVTGRSDGDFTCHMFRLKHAVAHFAVRNLSGILTIELGS